MITLQVCGSQILKAPCLHLSQSKGEGLSGRMGTHNWQVLVEEGGLMALVGGV